MTAQRIAAHADAVFEILKSITTMLGTAGRPADRVIDVIREALDVIVGPDTAHDPAAIEALGESLAAELAKRDDEADAELAGKFDGGEP